MEPSLSLSLSPGQCTDPSRHYLSPPKPHTHTATLKNMTKPLSVLVVDDSETSRKMVVKLLKMRGHICYEAKDGAAAVEMISSLYGYDSDLRPAFATIDAVLMDNHMPHLSGTRFVQLYSEKMSQSWNEIEQYFSSP